MAPSRADCRKTPAGVMEYDRNHSQRLVTDGEGTETRCEPLRMIHVGRPFPFPFSTNDVQGASLVGTLRLCSGTHRKGKKRQSRWGERQIVYPVDPLSNRVISSSLDPSSPTLASIHHPVQPPLRHALHLPPCPQPFAPLVTRPTVRIDPPPPLNPPRRHLCYR